MNKKLMIVLCFMLIALCGCGNNTSNNAMQDSNMESNEKQSESASDISLLGEIEVDKNLLTVEITVPPEYVAELKQEDLDETAKEIGVTSIILNDDGSATYKMTKAQHKKFLSGIRDSINSSLREMIGSEKYPNITAITANSNFTEFKVTTKNRKLDIDESFSTFTFYMNGFVYSIFSGEDVDNVSVTFINADSGEVIETANSKDMGSAENAENTETKSATTNPKDTGNAESIKSTENTETKNTSDMIFEIRNWYVGDIWNNFVDFDSYRERGKDCTGSDIDIEFAYEYFKKSYALKDEYNAYINSLSDDYSDLKNVWQKMNEQIESIYNDLEINGIKEGMPGLKLDLLSQYADKFYEYAK